MTGNGVVGGFVNNFGRIGLDPDLIVSIPGGIENKYDLKKVKIDCGFGSIWN
jgi:hypothetical protein